MNAELYVLRRTVFKLSRIIGQTYDYDIWRQKNRKHRSIVRCEKYLYILNRLDVDHECDGRTDGWTDRMTFSSSAV